jgi:pimeloyl-ACP methyl ester carboxylesterase
MRRVPARAFRSSERLFDALSEDATTSEGIARNSAAGLDRGMPELTTSDGTKLRYTDWGSGRPMLLVHGWGINSDMWEYQIPAALDRGFRCVAPDRRGFGRSDRPGHGYDYDRLAEDLADLLEFLDLTDVVLVSHSMGSGEVARYLARHSTDRISAVVLASPTLPFMMRTADNPEGIDPAVLDYLMTALRTDRPGLIAELAPGALGSELPGVSLSPALIEWAIAMFHQGSAQANIECLRTHWTTDQRADLAAFTVPTLVVHGAADTVVPIDHTARRLESLLPKATLTVYDNASHWLFLTHLERFNNDLLAFAEAH